MITIKPYEEYLLMTTGTILDAATRLMTSGNALHLPASDTEAINRAFKMYDTIVNRLTKETEDMKEKLTVKDAFNG